MNNNDPRPGKDIAKIFISYSRNDREHAVTVPLITGQAAQKTEQNQWLFVLLISGLYH